MTLAMAKPKGTGIKALGHTLRIWPDTMAKVRALSRAFNKTQPDVIADAVSAYLDQIVVERSFVWAFYQEELATMKKEEDEGRDE